MLITTLDFGGDAVYVTNPGKVRVEAEWRKGQARRKLILKLGEARILSD